MAELGGRNEQPIAGRTERFGMRLCRKRQNICGPSLQPCTRSNHKYLGVYTYLARAGFDNITDQWRSLPTTYVAAGGSHHLYVHACKASSWLQRHTKGSRGIRSALKAATLHQKEHFFHVVTFVVTVISYDKYYTANGGFRCTSSFVPWRISCSKPRKLSHAASRLKQKL